MQNKNLKYYIAGGILLLILIFFVNRCSKEEIIKEVPVKVYVPGVSGKSDTIYKPVPLISIKDSLIYKDKILYTENPYDKELADKYISLKGETERLQVYLKTIQIKEYSIPFEDDNIKITGHFKTQGELLSTQYDYDIKPKEIIALVPQKETKLALYAGGGIGTNIDLNKVIFNAQIGIQNAKGDIYTVQYGTDKSIQVGYQFRIFNIKR